MKTIQKAVQVGVLSAIAVSASPAFAESTRGFYLGVSGGQASVNIAKSDVDNIAITAFNDQGVPVLSRSSTFDKSDTSVAVIAGYRFLPYVAVETSYIDFGTAKYVFSGTVNPPGPVTSTPARLTLDFENKGFTVAGIGSLPLGRFADLHGRIGLLVAQTKISATASISPAAPASDSDDTTSASVLIGVGVGFYLGRHVELSVDWIRYDNVGDNNDDNDIDTKEGFDIDTASISFKFRF
jgi:OmpA-OmpF porin, OOP family